MSTVLYTSVMTKVMIVPKMTIGTSSGGLVNIAVPAGSLRE